MDDAFVLKGRLVFDTSDVDDALGKAKKQVSGFGEEAEKSSKKTRDFGDALQHTLSHAAGNLLSQGLREAWDALKQFTAESVSAASNLAEVQNVVDVTFGDGAAQINAWAKASLSSYGMSELKAKKYVSTMGAMLKSMGLNGEAAQEMSMNVVSLAADMASFYNLDHEEVMTKIRSGFAGEIEPLRQLGINMSVANLEAYAMAQGIDKAYSSMTQAEQAMLRYNFLLDATADAQGDFTRTSDEYANQVKVLQGNLEQVKTLFGNALLDILTPAIAIANRELAEWLEEDNPITKQTKEIYDSSQNEIDAAEDALEDVTALVAVLESLGEETKRTDEEQRIWQTTLEDLVRTMPELAQYIDLTNGTISVTTDELLMNAQAITEWAKAAAEIKAADQMRSVWMDAAKAYAETEQDLIFWKAKRRRRGQEYTAAFNELKEELGGEYDQSYLERIMTEYNMGQEWTRAFDEQHGGVLKRAAGLYAEVIEANEKIEELEADLTAKGEDLEIAKEAHEEWVEITEEKNKAQKDAMAATEDFRDALESEQAALTSVGEAAKKLKEYYDSLKESARGSLQSVAGSLASDIETKTVELASVIDMMNKKNEQFSLYTNNIIEARQMGMDAGMLAYLTSDPSAENRAILDAWVNGSDEQRAMFNDSYKNYRESEDAAASQMANAQAAVDGTYQSLEKELNDMVDAFNKSDDVASAIDMTNVKIDEGMRSMITTVQAGVNSINEILSGLPGAFNLNFSVGGNVSNSSGDNAATNAKGIGYVPYDDYLTYLHKGETVLNRVEAENWRKGATTQSAGIDYDRLATVLATQMAGMSMQMDGKMIGALIAPVVSRNIEKDAWRGRY